MLLHSEMTSAISIRLIFPLLILGLSHADIRAEQPKPSNLQISVSDRFKQPFLADEKNIRKLREIIEKRGSELCQNTKARYQTKFSNNTSYESTDLEPILNEPNRSPQTIIYISMKLDSYECMRPGMRPGIEVELSTRSFDEGLTYSISGNNRDWIYLTQADITKHMESMFINYWLPRWAWKALISALMCCIAVGGAALLLYWAYRRDLSRKSPATQPLTFARFLVHDSNLLGALVAIGVLTVMVSGIFADNPSDLLWPSGVFLIGDEIKKYEEISSFRTAVLYLLITSILGPNLYRVISRYLRRADVHLS